MMVVSGALIGIGYGSVTPVFQTQIISSVEPHKIGVANSLFFNAMDAGLALGACVMGDDGCTYWLPNDLSAGRTISGSGWWSLCAANEG